MLDLVAQTSIQSMNASAIANVRKLEKYSADNLPQLSVTTSHIIHAGVYTRTITIPSGVMITGVLIKIPTILIVVGHVVVYLGGESKEIRGYNIFPAAAHRKQAFVAITDTELTMLFATKAKTVAEAEAEFTDELDLLVSRHEDNLVTVTGD